MLTSPTHPQTGQRLTTNAFRALPENNAVLMQHIEGVVYVDSPVYSHQEALLRIAVLFHTLATHGTTVIAPMDVYLDADTCQPDIFWVGPNSRCHLRPDGKWQGPPDLVVEILSPSTAALDRGVKYDLYERQEVGEYWLVDLLADVHFIEVHNYKTDRFERVGAFVTGDTLPSRILSQTLDVSRILPPVR